ncbi:hypothetical protein [Massilia sp. TN1-12]|uniref:hypothetical protein n=1 Tax=Massilia paldalensis TaxID=3377675 RepID=UPI00384F848D
MEHESHHHHHPHGTGLRWLDIVLGVCATVVSLVSLWLGIHSAHSMEKLVAANSYPYVDLMRSMGSDIPLPGTDRNRRVVEYLLANNGVGPARVEWVELRYKGKPVANIDDLLDACCATKAHDTSGVDRRGNVVNALIPPRASVKLFTWTEQPHANADFDTLHRSMKDIAVSACYCSVFDECYVRRENNAEKPEAVAHCPAPELAFAPRFRTD